MVTLPWDLLPDILAWLPVKSIARFRCVNKAWCKLLRNTEFLKRQYKHAVEMKRFSIMFHNQNDIYTFSYDPLLSTCEGSGHVEYPVKSVKMGIEFFGCCNGLVFLRHVNKFNSAVLILWNPSSNECKKLPDPPTKLKEHRGGFVEYGFGYDCQIEDFKVVRIAQGFKKGWCEVQVFSLRSNSWRRLEDIQVDKLSYDFNRPDMCRLPVNGALHWKALVGGDLGTDNILRFDFEKEEFDQISIPDEVNDDHERHLCVLGGSLWLLVNEYGCSLEFWELKDSEGKRSWNRCFSIDIDKFDSDKDLIPLQLLENGKILFGVHSGSDLQFVLYDQKRETTRTLKVHEGLVTSSFPTSVYVESLISLETGTYLGKVQWGKVEEDVSEEKEGEEEEDKVEVEDEEDDGGTGAGVAGTSDDNDEEESK
ncbi:F-box protein CPR1-like [Papaver somniferum]|nr:F-box protein CPR1-like [Papaver somniferum]